MKTTPWIVIGLACLPVALFHTACSSTTEPPPPAETATSAAFAEGVPGGLIVNTLEVTAKVTAIDHTTRKVTLLGPDGKKLKAKVGPEAVNFDQIQVGDLVKATVTEELLVYLDDQAPADGGGSAAMVALAPKGAQPGGVIAETTQVTGTVTAIDLQQRTATLQFEDGTTKTFPVRDDVNLGERKVGDKVVFQLTEAVALKVVKP